MKHILLASAKRKLYAILCIAFLIRFGYILYGYFTQGNAFLINGDSFSFTNSIIHLFENGSYTFDAAIPDAAFGRLPGYPLFWGVHYLAFGSNSYLAVAVSQAILDSTVCYLFYKTTLNIRQPSSIGLLIAGIYAFYPFSIFWVPITGTETVAIFLTVFYIYLLSLQRYHSLVWHLQLGITVAAAFYVREYLGVLFPITTSYLFFLWIKKSVHLRTIALYAFTFLVLYSLWPIRNYLSYNRIEFLKPSSTGYRNFGADFNAFREWMFTWTTDIEPQMSKIKKGQSPELPVAIFNDQAEYNKTKQLLDSSLQCGSSFADWQGKQTLGTPCDISIATGFDKLKGDFIIRDPIRYYVALPLKNLNKAFFKNNLSTTPSSPATKALFLWRTILVLLGFSGVFFFMKSLPGFACCAFALFMYLFICFHIRQVEMRYLIQADVCLLLPAVLSVTIISRKIISLVQR